MTSLEIITELTNRIKRLENRVKVLEGEKVTKFTPPTLEEVKAYCKERNNSVDPGKFVDFYQSKNWIVGKVKMKDWRASIRTWEKSTIIAEPLGTNKAEKLPLNYGVPSKTAVPMPASLKKRIKETEQ